MMTKLKLFLPLKKKTVATFAIHSKSESKKKKIKTNFSYLYAHQHGSK